MKNNLLQRAGVITTELSQEEILARFKKKGKKGKTTTNSTVNAIVDYLNLNGFLAWKSYNGGVYNEKAQSYIKDKNKLKGVPDICGFDKRNGKAIFIEQKTGKDTLKHEQIMFLAEAKAAGCLAFISKTSKQAIDEIDVYLIQTRTYKN